METSTVTFASMLEQYIGGQTYRSGFWQRFKDREWRLTGTKHYKRTGTREAVLARLARRRWERAKKRSGKILFEEFVKRDFLLSGISKDELWGGGSLIVPFRGKSPMLPAIYEDLAVYGSQMMIVGTDDHAMDALRYAMLSPKQVYKSPSWWSRFVSWWSRFVSWVKGWAVWRLE